MSGAGIEVWFDKRTLRGVDAWDRLIRQQINDCALFVPIISEHMHERLEGYFRREWRLAVERAGDMAENKAFLVPGASRTTGDTTAFGEDSTSDVCWKRY